MKRNRIFKSVLAIVASLGIVIVIGLGRGGAEAAEKIKIGVVNFQRALGEVEQGKKAKATLKSEFDARQKKLDLQQQELKKMQEEMEKQKAVLSQDALMSKQKVFSEKYLQLQKSMASYRDELISKESKLTGQILQNLKKIVGEIGQKEGFALIVENSQETVLFAEVENDLTGRVVSMYNQKFTGPIKTE